MAFLQQRTVDWCISRAYVHAMRKATAPAATSPKYNALLAIADSMQKLWAQEPEVEWASLFSLTALSAIVSAGNTVSLDLSVNYLVKREGSPILITPTTGGTPRAFDVIDQMQLYEYRYRDAAAQVGRNLIFSRAFQSTDALIGGQIQVPSYTFPPDLQYPTDVVAVDDPMWLVYMMAAEYVRNDVVKRQEYNNLLTLADHVMQKMIDANGGQREEVATPWRPAGESWI